MTRKQSNAAVLEPPTNHSTATVKPHPATPAEPPRGPGARPPFRHWREQSGGPARVHSPWRRRIASCWPSSSPGRHAWLPTSLASSMTGSSSSPPTLAFFEAFAASRKMPLAAVRQLLETSQAGYIHRHLQWRRAELGSGVLRRSSERGLGARPDQSSVQVVHRLLHRNAAAVAHLPAPRFQRAHGGAGRRGHFQGLQLRHAGHRRFVPAQHAGIDGPQRRSHRANREAATRPKASARSKMPSTYSPSSARRWPKAA